MDVSVAAAALSLGASVTALLTAMVAVLSARHSHRAADVKLDRIAHQLTKAQQEQFFKVIEQFIADLRASHGFVPGW
ncbi:MAG: hypothetical protein ACRDTC_05035 [Pseudonocardiaceae bacterium]